MRLLLVEDEHDIQAFLRRSLQEAGYQVDAASDGKSAEHLATENTYDILVVDLGLPDCDGITLILRLRQIGVKAPVLILSARRSVDDRVRGLEQGGDDYLTKPFALAELLARLRNLLKRNVPAGSESTRLRVLDLELDLLRREATRSGEVLQLTPQEFVLLEYLCRNAGRVVTRISLLCRLRLMTRGYALHDPRQSLGHAHPTGYQRGRRAYLSAARKGRWQGAVAHDSHAARSRVCPQRPVSP